MIKTKILVVEDETIVALDIKRSLIKMDFDVTDTVTNYDDAITSVKSNKPDFIIMDINLENSKDGIITVQAIQKIENIPVIYLSAFCDDETIQRAIQTNPLIYLSKPFKKDELKTTILLGLYKVNHQNHQNIDQSCFKLGFDYYYDLEKGKLFYKDMPIKLSSNENKLLRILIEARGAIVSFGDIEFQIWPETPTSDSTLRTLVYRLRTKLEYKLVETVPTFGCKLTHTF